MVRTPHRLYKLGVHTRAVQTVAQIDVYALGPSKFRRPRLYHVVLGVITDCELVMVDFLLGHLTAADAALMGDASVPFNELFPR